jgi:uncharacterized protein
MASLRSLLLDLFYHLRADAQMKLTIDQFDLLCRAVEQGYGIQDWQGLRRVCRLILVKPHEFYEGERFEAAFGRYQERCREAIRVALVDTPRPPVPTIVFKTGMLPQLPARKLKASQIIDEQPKQPQQALTAVRVPTADRSMDVSAQFVLRELPMAQRSVQMTWLRLRSLAIEGQMNEVDCDRTVAQILRTGLFSDVVLRSTVRRRGELLLLVDDDNPMLPFRPAVQPLLDAVAERRIRPALVYRFTTYPVDYFYQWQQPTEAVAVSTVLSRLHRQRTTVMIVSDAGAASRSYNPERLRRTGQFLEKLLPCVRDILWLNPLPRSRWAETSAATLAHALNGRMVPFGALRSPQRESVKEGVQLWLLTP